MATKKIPSFGINGRPKKISFSDLFLWTPNIEIDLSGVSMSQVLGAECPEMLALHQDMGRKRKISEERMISVVPDALEVLGFPMADEFRKAFNGEESKIKGLGLWAMYLYGRAMEPGMDWPPKLAPLGDHVIDIERALVEPTLAWQKEEYSRCADLISAAPVLSGYLWPEVIAKIRNATTQQEMLEARLFVALEIQLSWLACWDAQFQVDGYATEPMLNHLFPDLSTEEITQPNALFFKWLAEYSGMKRKLSTKIVQVTKLASETSDDSIKRQLRRWKSGKGFPSDDVLDALYRNIYGPRAHEKTDKNRKHWALCWSMAKATKRINFLMPLLAPMARITGPGFPFGHTSIQEWRESRYRHWYEHWLPLLEAR